MLASLVKAVDVNTTTGDLILIGALAAIWLTAGLLADGLPVAATAGAVGRRAGLLSILVGAGAAVLVIVAITGLLMPGTSAPAASLPAAVPALIVLTAGLHRLTKVRRAAAAFATAPLAPLPPALRAAAAHPMIAGPMQVTGLAALIGLPIAGGMVTVPGTNLVGIAVAVVAVAVTAIGIRHALRHSRLNSLSFAPIRRTPRQLTSVR